MSNLIEGDHSRCEASHSLRLKYWGQELVSEGWTKFHSERQTYFLGTLVGSFGLMHIFIVIKTSLFWNFCVELYNLSNSETECKPPQTLQVLGGEKLKC